MNPVRGLSERSLLKREAVWSSLEISASPGSEGYRGGVENGDFYMLFWILPAQDASNRGISFYPDIKTYQFIHYFE